MANRPARIWNATTGEWDSISGVVPTGGTTGQTLSKATDADGDVTWSDVNVTTPVISNDVILAQTATYEGVFHRIGTGEGSVTWVNPATQVTFSASALAFGPYSNMVDRSSATEAYTTNVANSWFRVDLGVQRTLECDSLSLRQRNATSSNFQSVTLHGSNDGTNWTQIGGTLTATTGTSVWNTWQFTRSAAYRHFKITMTSTDSSGQNEFCVGEWELFGRYIGPNSARLPLSPLLLMGA